MNKPLFQKVDCVMLYVPDLDEAIAFYQDRLGHCLIWRAAYAAGLKMPDTDTEIVLQIGEREKQIDFLVASADEAAREFEKAGGTIVNPPFDIHIGRCAVVKDPWGHELVLLDMSKGRLITDAQGNIIGNERPES
jgi:lactoylglutathione lyase